MWLKLFIFYISDTLKKIKKTIRIVFSLGFSIVAIGKTF